MNKEQILQEEKEYWQAEALKARELVEQHAAATRKAREEIKVLEEFKTESICKLAAITNLAAQTDRGAMPEINYNTTCATDLQDMVRERAMQKRVDNPEYFLMAWMSNGSFYLDTRALSSEGAKKMRTICDQRKVALYAKVVK